MVSNDGSLLGEVSGPLWAPCPQTPQGAEFGAFLWSSCFASAETDLYIDCKNVVDQAGLSAARAFSHKKQYGGAILQARHLFGVFFRSCTKVQAHKALDEEGISAFERFARQGNYFADHVAKSALQKHPSADP
eukprot:8932665-Pyramimonas_sp.AAC.1